MTDWWLVFIILTATAAGSQIGYAFGVHRAYKKLIPELWAEREEVAKLKLLARLGGVQTAPIQAETREAEGLNGGAQ